MNENLIPKSVRMSVEEWEAVDRGAKAFGLERAVFMRRLVLSKLHSLEDEIARRLDKDTPLPF